MYHYTESGLDNVWLENGFHERNTPYGKAVSIEDVDGLHAILALRISHKQGRITGKEFRFLRCQLELSQASLAKLMGLTEQAVSLWERTGKVPKHADSFVRLLVLAKLDGKQPVAKVLERITVVDRLVNEKIVARETTRKKWTAAVRKEEASPV